MLDNPLREGLSLERLPSPCAMVIFGASGDLTRRKLMPALYDLALEGLLPPGFSVIGYARSPKTNEEFRAEVRESIQQFARRTPIDEGLLSNFEQGVSYVSGDFSSPDDYARLNEELDRLDRERNTSGNRVYYLATPPSAYANIAHHLADHGMVHPLDDERWTRLIVEKPFGHDLQSARELNETLLKYFAEEQIYRIDHYLGKETVQNMLAFRFANGIFEPIWNRTFIDHVQITVAESIGIENRGGYYDQAGALRDMVQNHMLQLLSLVSMEPPPDFDAESVHDEKVKALRSIRPYQPEDVEACTVRGQYREGWVMGQPYPGYRDEARVDEASVTETYVALKLFIDNWRWAGVPFYLRTGKHLPRRVSEIAIQFHKAPHPPFESNVTQSLEPNVLAIRIQPDEGITLKTTAKVPGPSMRLRSVNMGFLYGTSFLVESPDAYERLLLDCMLGDSTLFPRRDGIEASWEPITQILEGWDASGKTELPGYPAGTWGPDEADEFMERDGRQWRQP
ncbi:MAG: glucose-6-phosphate dehydrogenase [Sphaerobacteraceae bacterium]|nr:MAG: glucose-6-phosphate dehydrogenase [Sphaerobacteraceae bacterium]